MEKEAYYLSGDQRNSANQKISGKKQKYDIYSQQVTKAEEKAITIYNPTAAINGNNSKQVARDGINRLHARADYQQDLVDDIGKDLIESHQNLTTVVTEIKSQGETIKRVQNNLGDTGVSIKRADKNITKMSKRAVCHKCLLHILAVLLFIACIVVLVIKLTNK